MSSPGQCPVCQARFRSVAVCPRCGADLSRLMRLAARAWYLRGVATEALRAGDYERARRAAAAAEGMVRTRRGASLELIAGWMERRA